MKASLRILALGLFLLVPFTAASAQAPSLSVIPAVSVNAGETKTVNVVAVDASGRDITLTSALPSFVTLNTPTFGTGVVVTTLSFAPSAVHVGTYTAAVTASAGGIADIEIFTIRVNPSGSDHVPAVAAPPLREVAEGSNLNFTVTVTDADGDIIEALFTSPLPTGATFITNGSGTSGVFNWTPGFSASGEYDVVFSAMAMNGPVGSAVTHIRVADVPPLTITPIPDATVETGSSISVPVIATGLPGALITLTATLPSFATLHAPGTGTGSVTTTISIAPPPGSAGTYHASVTATSSGEVVTESFDIIVTGTGGGENRAPVLSAPASETIAVGSTLTFDVTATDADGDHVTLSATGSPPGSNFLDHANNTGTFSWSPVNGQAGTYTASFTGLDGRGGSGSASTQITVTGGTVENHPPTLTAPLTQQVAEGVNLSFSVTATDQDGDHVTLSANGTPTGANFSDQGDNTGTFSWTPSSTQSGTYSVAFNGNDGNGGTGTASTTITVTDVVENQAPVLSAPLTQQVAEGVNLSFSVTATDQDGDHVTLTASAPTGATFSDQGDNTGIFSWTPGSAQSGVHTAAFNGNDGNGGTGTASTTITVTDVAENHPPTLTAPATQQVAEGASLSFTVTATDQDGDHVTLSANGTPTGANFSDQGDNTGIFAWTPSSAQSGVYYVTFTGDDGNGGTGTAGTTITVTDVVENHPPVLSAPLTQQVDEGVSLSFSVTATDQDGDHVTLGTNGTPTGATFSDQGDNTGIFSWTPSSTQSGVYDVTFTGDDGNGGTGTASTTITVADVGGGSAEVPGKACLIGSFQSRDGKTCFRIKPVRGSFDLRDVVLSSITFVFHGASVPALNDGTRIELRCHGGHDGDDGDGDGRHDAASIRFGGDHDDDGDDDKRNCGGVVCGEHGGNNKHGDGHDGGDCDTLGIRACFSTQALRDVLDGAKMPCDLVHAEIHATLTSGALVVATFGKDRHPHDGDDDGDDDGKDNDKDNDGDRDARHVGMNPKVRPNPLNPSAVLTFTTSREGRVRVSVYDMQGRLVKSLLDGYRAAGVQTLGWDGTSARSQRVASGVYFFQIQAPEGDIIQRVAVVK